MDFRNIPRALIVTVVLCGFLVFLFLSKPPHTRCNSQLELFQVSQTPFLYPDPKLNFQSTIGYKRSVTTCKTTNSVGGCLEYFEGLKLLLRDLENLPSDCGEEVAEFPSIKPAMKSSLEFLAQLAWGVGAPKSTFERLGWMDQSQLSIFCRMKAQYARRFGKENFDILREQTIQKLPGAAELGREEAWRRSLFSASCSF